MSREMKDSGIPWIGEIPKDWEIKRLKQESVFINGYAFNSDDFKIDEGVKVIRIGDIGLNVDFDGCVKTIVDTNLLTPFRIKDGDILIAMSGATTGKCCIVDKAEEAYINQRVGIIRSDINKFIYYSLMTPYFMEFVNLHNAGSAQPNISSKAIGEFPILMMSLPEQQKIASFLDRKCSEIDEMIALQEQIVEELKAYKQSVISEAVTKGLNPAVPMKDSGIEWIGQIPEHWEVCRVKNLSKMISKGATPPTIDKESYEGNVRFIKCENISNNELVNNSLYYISTEINESMKRSQLEENDVLFVIAGATIGKTAIVGKEFLPSNTNQAVSFIRLKDAQKAKFLWYVLQSNVVQVPLWVNAVQSAQPNLSMENLGNFNIPSPIDSEQQAIADYLDEKCADIDSLIQTKQSKIDSLKEYKKSIIYEYVTGKREVE